MGADICVSVLVSDMDTELDWDAVGLAIEELPEEEMESAADEFGYMILGDEDRTEIRNDAKAVFEELAEIIRDDQNRDVASWDFRGATLWVTGGMSWGDSPTDSFDVFNRAYYFPSILKAIGFRPEGD